MDGEKGTRLRAYSVCYGTTSLGKAAVVTVSGTGETSRVGERERR
jgi:hypothetical protein